MADIPFLETQLLPSLRDTIDRMTHAPLRQGGPDDEMTHGHEQSHLDKRGDEYSRRLVVSQAKPTVPVTSPAYASALATTSQRNPKSTPVTPTLGIASSDLLGTPSAARSNKNPSSKAPSRIPGTSRVPPKSTRLDSPISSSIPNTPLLSPRFETTSGKSLKAVRGIAAAPKSRKLSPASNMRSPAVPSPGSSTSTQSSTSKIRTPNTTPRIPDYPRYQTSNLPRAREFTDSGSELEREYGKRFIAGRLVVANAEVVPSSSESERDDPRHERFPVDEDRPTSKSRTPRTPKEVNPYQPPRTQPRSPAIPSSLRPGIVRDRHIRTIGLGLHDYSELERGRSRTAFSEDDTSAYDSEDQPETYYEPKAARRTSRNGRPGTYSVADRYSWGDRDINDGRPADVVPQEQLPESTSGRRRREALIGLVNGLEPEAPLPIREQEIKSSGRNGSRRELCAQDLGTPDPGPDHYDLENYDETLQEDRKHSRTGKERSRQRTITQPARLPPSSKAQTQDTGYVGRNDKQDHRRSISLPPRNYSSHQPEEILGADEPQALDRIHPGDDEVPGTRNKKSRHRTSMSTSRANTRRRSGAGIPAAAPTPRPKAERRSSSHTADTGGHRSHRKSDSVARDRAAFGIPDSLSYAGYDVPEATEGVSPRVPSGPQDRLEDCSLSEEDPRASIPRSTPEGERWQQPDTDGFSSAAQALFNQLSGHHDDSARRKDPSRRRSGTQHPPMAHVQTRSSQYLPDTRPAVAQHDRSISASSSAPSVYEGETDQLHHHEDVQPVNSPSHADHTAESWRSMLHPATYERLVATHGQAEIKRQELIYRLCSAHSEFVRRLRSIVAIFIVPLRREHSKVWLPGVPKEVSNLFDWLEDIWNFHRALEDSLRSATKAWQAGQIIVDIARVFRTFVPRLEIYQPYLVRVEDIQHVLTDRAAAKGDEFGQFVQLRQHEECEGQTLAELLMLPVHHLYSAVDNYKELWRATPTTHSDYLAALSLYQSMRMIVHVMHEVKIREEEYDFVKDMAKSIDGLLPSVQLARRERRLLWYGDMNYLPQTGAPSSKRDSHEHQSSILSPSLTGRSGSHRTPAIVLSPCPTSPALDDNSRRSSKSTDKSPVAMLSVAVFTDIVLLAEVTYKNSRVSRRLFTGAGLSKVLFVSVEQLSAGTEGPTTFVLGLLPLSQSDLQSGMIPDTSTTICVRLGFPPGLEALKENEAAILSAFRRCRAYTLQSLSFPSHSGQYLPHGPQVDLELDTQRTVMDILNTGLPLPKSPSVQFKDNQRLGTREVSDTDREREERGWWTLRFQQVLREMQRQDPMLSLTIFEDE
ncbi:hypothetical protein PHLGIDRAFT_120165 [Phlebiopsis gigantea 11061_1 CR5-6]|uniref:DH domain-containing protein n=1 Tax=Phlebiopsis gigantea (strain 11061_1 CR5-6) TaxID=745531 RepID=A0A0C3NJG5_PHLG1|nr:hypothetical protein PHLGIDRAFT_120165 [Phlebiopsis gigantea 11061_1 CR5-6]